MIEKLKARGSIVRKLDLALKRKQLQVRRSSRKLTAALDIDSHVHGSTSVEGRIGMLEERILKLDAAIDTMLHRAFELHAVVAFITFEEVEGERRQGAACVPLPLRESSP